ncbi:acyl carrier protein [Betaproteobacteria bacterium]|nr:acyl carrier protein [Betaproteobacteria bacterium]GHU43960.1 acyl carrier protein [Betaproteobacteria bacterium]
MTEKFDREATYALIAKLLTELFAIPPEKITPDANLYQDLDIDSIDAVDLAIEFKKRTGRQLTPDEFKRIRTVGDIVKVIHTLDTPAQES